ncbi:hypothetical protein CVT26_001235 [Gymnopilus dilepis]|uniref:Uncharacterized protein n=1 Tax=Gymnopilus dilepis TaxID=231916 RepID=A0A409WBF6_9AGAR|nr:hypothetical protein CVT26_001235 [Gymnopilus dilepis]
MDTAVDALAKAQRIVKYMAAWCAMASAIIQGYKGLAAGKEVRPSDETLMGIWLDGCPEPQGLWFLRHGVPCYIIHEADSSQDVGRADSYRPLYRFSFYAGTPIEALKLETHPIDSLALEKGRLNNLERDHAVLPPGQGPPSSYLDNLQSSPLCQGCVNSVYMGPKSFENDNLCLLSSDPTTWPPPVASATSGLARTTWIQERESDGPDCLVKKGRRYRTEDDLCWFYDRVLCRKLAFTEEPMIPYSYRANPRIFGLPAPDLPCEELVGNEWKRRQPSKHQHPAPGTVGLKFVAEPLNQTPPPAPPPLRSSPLARTINLDVENKGSLSDVAIQRSNTVDNLSSNPQRVTPGPPYLGRERERTEESQDTRELSFSRALQTTPALRDSQIGHVPAIVLPLEDDLLLKADLGDRMADLQLVDVLHPSLTNDLLLPVVELRRLLDAMLSPVSPPRFVLIMLAAPAVDPPRVEILLAPLRASTTNERRTVGVEATNVLVPLSLLLFEMSENVERKKKSKWTWMNLPPVTTKLWVLRICLVSDLLLDSLSYTLSRELFSLYPPTLLKAKSSQTLTVI